MREEAGMETGLERTESTGIGEKTLVKARSVETIEWTASCDSLKMRMASQSKLVRKCLGTLSNNGWTKED